MAVINLFVNTTLDENDGQSGIGTGLSLRDAILAANSDTANEYVIVLEAGATYSLSIDNSRGDEELGSTGDLDIAAGAKISIVTTDGSKAIISAAGVTSGDRVFDVLTNARLSLNNVEITGGSTQDNGGAIYIENAANVMIANSNIQDNTARIDGGAIYNEGTLSIEGSNIADNESFFGGGIANYGMATVTDSSLTGNTAKSGGALYNQGTFELSDSTITGNNAVVGGAIHNAGDSLEIMNTTIASNTAISAGGGIYNEGNAKIEDSDISSNMAAVSGGGIVNLEEATIAVVDSSISNNQADNGGGIDNFGTVALVGTTISNNTGNSGAGLKNSGEYSQATLVNAIIAGNQATGNGGGIANEGQLTATNTTVANNESQGEGGGIFNDDEMDANATLRNSIVAQNTGNDLSGTFRGNANNLVGNLTGASGSIGTSSDIVNNNPLLSPNYELLPGSPAINAGRNNLLPKDTFDLDGDGDTNEVIPLDSKGNNRIVNGTVDIGAVEFSPALDIPGITIAPNTVLTTSEDGGTAQFTIVLDTKPTANVTIELLNSDSTEGMLSTTSVTFTPDNWNIPQAVTVTGADDALADGSVPYTIITSAAQSADSQYNGIDADNVSLVNNDNDRAGINISPVTGLFTNENGTTAQFSIALNSQPTANVTITLASDDPTEGTITVSSITFTPDNWNVAQTVTVTGVDDVLADGSTPYTIITNAASADASYNELEVADVRISNEDNDQPGITVNPASGIFTNENGDTVQFTVVLNSQPTADVTIPLSSSDATEGLIFSAPAITFTPDNWNIPQAVSVVGIDDLVVDGNVPYTIITAAAVSDDINYNGLDATDVSAVNNDNDRTAIVINPVAGLFTNENGSTTQFTVVLNSQPTSDVTIALASDDPTEGTITVSSITFTPDNWNVAQTVTVTGVDDALADGSVPYTVVTAAAQSLDANYNGLNAEDVRVTNNDNETAGITVNQTGGLITNENGSTAQLAVVLNSQPTSDVTIALSSSDTTEGTVSTSSITFTSANWNIPQAVTVMGVDDAVADGSVSYNIVTAAAVSADSNYNGIDAADVSVTNEDNDIAGITVSPIGGLVTNENGTTAEFTVVLNSQPTSNVTIELRSNDTTEGTISTSALTFTPANWNLAQTVTVEGMNDSVIDGNVPYIIVTAAAVSTDANYNGLGVADVNLINNDNDGAPIAVEPPSVPDDKPGVVSFDKLPDLDFSTFQPFESSEDGGQSEPNFKLERIGDLPNNGGLRTASLLAAATAPESVQGSFVNDSTTNNLTFAKTGAPLGSGLYQMTLKTDGMLDVDGNPIDGDGDGNPGGDFVFEFPVDNRGKRTFQLEDFVAAPGQSVKLPSSGGKGIDIDIDDATGLTKIEFDFVFDEDILGVTGVGRGANLPTSWTIDSQLEAPGRLQVTLSGTDAIRGGTAQLVNILADVLPTATYGSSQLLQLDEIELNDGAIESIGDVGVHQVSNLGDLSGDGKYSSLDAALAKRLVLGLDSATRANPLIDPDILGDIVKDGSLAGDDALSIAKKAVGLPQDAII
jgi:hypothetical protein